MQVDEQAVAGDGFMLNLMSVFLLLSTRINLDKVWWLWFGSVFTFYIPFVIPFYVHIYVFAGFSPNSFCLILC